MHCMWVGMRVPFVFSRVELMMHIPVDPFLFLENVDGYWMQCFRVGVRMTIHSLIVMMWILCKYPKVEMGIPMHLDRLGWMWSSGKHRSEFHLSFLCYVLCTMHYVFCMMCCVLCITYAGTMCYILCHMYCVLCIIYIYEILQILEILQVLEILLRSAYHNMKHSIYDNVHNT